MIFAERLCRVRNSTNGNGFELFHASQNQCRLAGRSAFSSGFDCGPCGPDRNAIFSGLGLASLIFRMSLTVAFYGPTVGKWNRTRNS